MDVGFAEIGAVIEDFESRLRAAQAELDALNVFPVADSDTGTNMVRTLGSITSAMSGALDLDDLAARVETAALDGRGNSGLIVGQFLAGLLSAAVGQRLSIHVGLTEAARWARDAVADPVEGTMLTVADVAARTVAEQSDLTLMLSAVRDAVDATPTQLAVLAERGVVDSGAAGLALFFQSLCSVMDPGMATADLAPSSMIVCNVGLDAPLNDDAPPNSGGRIPVAHEVQFRVPANLIDRSELQALLSSLGSDVVVAAAGDVLSAHVHVLDPHVSTAAISAAIETRPGAKAISYEVEPVLDVSGGRGVAP